MKKHFIRVIAAFVGTTLIASGCSISFKTSGSQDGGAFRSVDGGIHWKQVVNAGKNAKGKPVTLDSLDVIFFRFDPKNASTIYLSTTANGLYRSDDGGDLWVRTGIAPGSYRAFAIDPTAPSILYAASGGTIVKSVDGGAKWTTIYIESKPDRAFTDLAVNPTASNTVYASTNKGEILLSKDFGNTWQLFSKIGIADSIRSLFFAPGSGVVMYALSAGNGLFKSITTGQTWVTLKPNMLKFPNAWVITSIATLPEKQDTIYVGSGYGLLSTVDGGTTWQPIQTLVPFSSQPISFVAVNPQNPSIVYVIVGNRLRKSADGGKTWDAKILIPTSRLVSTMKLNTEKPDELFIGTTRPPKKK